jgi:hypothetical protein
VIVVGRIGRGSLATLVLTVVLLAVGGGGQALAAEPWWHVMAFSSPPAPKQSEAVVTLDIANVGDAIAGGVLDENLISGDTPITIVDRLPAGVTATHAHPEGGQLNKYGGAGLYPALQKCSIEEQVVTCLYGVPVQPYEHIEIGMSVQVASGAGRGVNEVEVSGGGAPQVISKQALAVEGVPSYGCSHMNCCPKKKAV